MKKEKKIVFRCIKNTSNRNFNVDKASTFFGKFKKGQYAALTDELREDRTKSLVLLNPCYGDPIFRAVDDITDADVFRERQEFSLGSETGVEITVKGTDVLMEIPFCNRETTYPQDGYFLEDYFEAIEIE